MSTSSIRLLPDGRVKYRLSSGHRLNPNGDGDAYEALFHRTVVEPGLHLVLDEDDKAVGYVDRGVAHYEGVCNVLTRRLPDDIVERLSRGENYKRHGKHGAPRFVMEGDQEVKGGYFHTTKTPVGWDRDFLRWVRAEHSGCMELLRYEDSMHHYDKRTAKREMEEFGRSFTTVMQKGRAAGVPEREADRAARDEARKLSYTERIGQPSQAREERSSNGKIVVAALAVVLGLLALTLAVR